MALDIVVLWLVTAVVAGGGVWMITRDTRKRSDVRVMAPDTSVPDPRARKTDVDLIRAGLADIKSDVGMLKWTLVAIAAGIGALVVQAFEVG